MHRRWLQRKQSLRYTLLRDLDQRHHVELFSVPTHKFEKVDKLVELLQERGFDPSDILTEVLRRCLTTSLLAL